VCATQHSKKQTFKCLKKTVPQAPKIQTHISRFIESQGCDGVNNNTRSPNLKQQHLLVLITIFGYLPHQL
jgi:riboflavin synthase